MALILSACVLQDAVSSESPPQVWRGFFFFEPCGGEEERGNVWLGLFQIHSSTSPHPLASPPFSEGRQLSELGLFGGTSNSLFLLAA